MLQKLGPNEDGRSLSTVEVAVERTMLGVFRVTQMRVGIRSFGLRRRSKKKDAAVYGQVVEDKVVWTNSAYKRRLMTSGINDMDAQHVKRIIGRPPARWIEFPRKSLEESHDAQLDLRGNRTHRLKSLDDQPDDRTQEGYG
ncbi:unnamed protein product [Angiostrongylus costaricensis]|uniref:Uncharacterized protein n=1 Tax=Angiostrongylus costaricensis TaxID=334426 RepID=A0A0R3PF32_ANGCS|nr:unnamed protein product [Angiostrongylus costaricensis]